MGERRFDLQAADRLVWIRLRQRNPNSQTLGSRGAGGNSREIRKFEVAYGSTLLRPSGESRPENSERESESKAKSNGRARNHWRKPPSENRQSGLVLTRELGEVTQTSKENLPAGPAVSGLFKRERGNVAKTWRVVKAYREFHHDAMAQRTKLREEK